MKYSLEEANQYFAIAYNRRFWQLWEKTEATVHDQDEMINLAHASLLHWADSPNCKQVNLSRGEYLVSLAYFAAGKGVPALYHAQKCHKITDTYRSEMRDFDFAHCSLIMAMALHLNDRKEDAAIFLEEAARLGEEIRGEKDKEIFVSDLRQAMDRMKK